MKTLLAILMLAAPLKANSFVARVTFYTGKQVSWQGVKKPQEGTTVATANNLKFGTKLSIPALKGVVGDDDVFVVHDRGPAVQSRKASKGKYPVIDVYVSSQAKINKLASTTKYHLVKVEVK